MGNKNNKPKKHAKLTSPPTIDELPVEIIYKILDELDICTIFTSLYHVCKRFDEILLTYREYHLNFQNLSLTNLKLICSRIHPEQVRELTFSDELNRSELMEFFFSKYSLDEFVHLQSLTLMQINNEELMNKILITIANQRSLLNFSSIKILNREETYGDIFLEILMSVLIRPSLREVHLDLSDYRMTSNPLPWIEECAIRHLKLTGTCALNFIRNAMNCLPQLETLKIDDFDFDEEIDLNPVPTFFENETSDEEEEGWEIAHNNEDQSTRKIQFASIYTPDHLKSLTITSCSVNMSKIEWILQEILTLKHLRLITSSLYDDQSILDGQRWENLLQNIDKFEFVFLMNGSLDSTWDIDTCIMKFQTPFWTKEKQWFVDLEKYDEEILLYTLPYRNHFYVMKNESSSLEFRSTANENFKLKVQSMNGVRDLYIDTSLIKVSQFENIASPRFSYVTKLNLYGKWGKSKTLFSDLQTIVNLNKIEELIRDECIPTVDFMTLLNLMPNLRSLKTTTMLLDALNAAKFRYEKSLRSFIIEYNGYEEYRAIHIEPFCDMFPRIENLIIPVDSVETCRYAIEHLNADLISVTFHIPNDDRSFSEIDYEDDEENPTPDVYSEWMNNELPKNYRCHKKQQQIHICLK